MSAEHKFYLNIWGAKIGFCLRKNGELIHTNDSYVEGLVITAVQHQIFKIAFSNSLTNKSVSFGILEGTGLNLNFETPFDSSFKLSEFSMRSQKKLRS